MFFNSFSFILFFIFVFFISRSIVSWKMRKLFLLIVSYIFYAAWNPPFVVLLWISTLADWYLARWIGRENNSSRKKFYLFLSLAVNLGLLAYFKYGTFFLENLNALLHFFGISHEFGKRNIILPAGISFYTFQTLSYTIDIYRKKIEPWPSALDYALYITFFPHLVAGPIMRADYLLPQCETPKKGSRDQIGWGTLLFVLGLFSKMVIADALMSPVVKEVYSMGRPLHFFEAWAGTFAFAVQIFCDFFGYSTCAVGIALMLGFVFIENFKSPYGAIGFSDFWRRWHISFSTWIRDYIYIPLGGNQKGKVRTYVNLMITMLLGGLWHGASWMFVIWGVLHGFFLAAERMLKLFKFAAHPFWKQSFSRIFLMLATFVFVCFAWVFFRAESIHTAFSIIHSMLGFAPSGPVWRSAGPITCAAVFGITAVLLTFHYHLRDIPFRRIFEKFPWWVQGGMIGTMILSILLSTAAEDHAFIYFQF